jgi:amidohydrolase
MPDRRLPESVAALSAAQLEQTIAWRRHLHQYPELSYQEHRTAAFVADCLRGLGIPFREGVGGTGLLAWIEGQEPERATLALRADMDALPIQEANEVPYRSRHEGVMHACGHDAHTASLLGAAALLQQLRGQFRGTVRLLFQPAEEKFPGGASLMLADGALANPAPFAVVGQHVHPPLQAGKLGFRSGQYMAAADELYFTLRGVGGHAAYPHLLIDPVLMSAKLVLNLQRVVSRFARPDQPCVLSIGRVIADGATNVIPGEVQVAGTFRSFDQDLRERAHEEIRRIARGTAELFGGQIDTEIRVGYPPLYNNPELTARLRSLAGQFVGPDNVVDLELSMGAEDFASYSQVAPGCFYRLGTGNPDLGITSPIHTPTFDIDETALDTGQGFLAWVAINELERQAAEQV